MVAPLSSDHHSLMMFAAAHDASIYKTLFENMDDGFCVIRFLDGPHGPLSDYLHVLANPAYERHTGIANVVGQYLREMVPDEADDRVDGGVGRKVAFSAQSRQSDAFEEGAADTRRLHGDIGEVEAGLPPGADPQPDKIDRTDDLQRREDLGARHQDCRNADGAADQGQEQRLQQYREDDRAAVEADGAQRGDFLAARRHRRQPRRASSMPG